MGIRQRALEGLEVNPAFWRDRRVFVTGHTGFKGSWLSLWLRRLGARVTGYSLLPPTDPSLFASAEIGRGMVSTLDDIRDLQALHSALRKSHAEIVLHLAAQSLVRASYANPIETYSVNVMGAANMLEAVRLTPDVRAVVIVTTDKCYENREWVWGYRETEAMGGRDPYSSSKGCAELVTAAYTSSFFPQVDYARHRVAVASARAGNVIGGGDWAADRLIPDIVRALTADQPVIVRNPSAVRPWQHVLEPLRGYLDLAEALVERGPHFNGGWNFGPTDEDARPVSWIVENAAHAWGEHAKWERDGRSHPHEAHYLKLDCSKARELLGWKPVLNLPAALSGTVDWYRAHSRNSNDSAYIRYITEQEIGRYEELLKW